MESEWPADRVSGSTPGGNHVKGCKCGCLSTFTCAELSTSCTHLHALDEESVQHMWCRVYDMMIRRTERYTLCDYTTLYDLNFARKVAWKYRPRERPIFGSWQRSEEMF